MTPYSAISIARTWLLAGFAALAVTLAFSTSADAKRKTFRAVGETPRTLVFSPQGIGADEVRRALAELRNRDGSRIVQRVRTARIRRAIARGTQLKVRRTSSVRSGTLTILMRRKVRPVADTTAPDTTINSGPSGTITSNSTTLGFSSSESGSTFQCKLDAGSWDPCSSPKGYSGLGDGAHAVSVRAIDAAGNTDASPASRSFTVDTVPDPTPDPDPDPVPDPGSCALGTPTGTSHPPACWRPYSDASPFNRPVPASAPVVSNSQAIVDRWVGFGDLNAPKFTTGTAGTTYDYDHPVYYATPSDPIFTVQCTQWVSSCEVHGQQVRIPNQAKPAAGRDGHLTVIDPQSGWEYDFWKVASKPSGGGVLTVSHGGKTQIDGDGLGSPATAAHYGLAAGLIRPEEIAAGEINHALFMVVNCTNGQSVAPAGSGTGRSCSSIGQSNTNAPRMGEHFVLDMTDTQINAMAIPAWRKTILRAMARYGLYVGDTGGGFLKVQSGSSWTSFGQADPWVNLGNQLGLPSWTDLGNTLHRFDLRTTLNWQSKLKIVDPCVARGTC